MSPDTLTGSVENGYGNKKLGVLPLAIFLLYHYHLPRGQEDDSNLAFTFIKHPHSLHVQVVLNSDGHSLQIPSLSNAFSFSTNITAP
jgi:hypothetical protein